MSGGIFFVRNEFFPMMIAQIEIARHLSIRFLQVEWLLLGVNESFVVVLNVQAKVSCRESVCRSSNGLVFW
jgi:hypothetical protein